MLSAKISQLKESTSPQGCKCREPPTKRILVITQHYQAMQATALQNNTHLVTTFADKYDDIFIIYSNGCNSSP